MKEKIRKVIKNIFGTKNNIFLKLSFSSLISGTLFLMFSVQAKEQNNPQAYLIFTYISAFFLGLWLSLIKDNNSVRLLLKELLRLFIFFGILTFSLDFCINSSINFYGLKLISGSIFSALGLISCSFYLTSKFVDILIFFKKTFKQIKEKLFNSVQPATSKTKALIENITAFLISVAGLGVAIKAIIEPLINMFK